MIIDNRTNKANGVKASPNNLVQTVELTQEIRTEAQKIYENRKIKNLEGDEDSDWLKAEAKVAQKHKTKKNPTPVPD
jgi:hypothetical protein